MLERTQRSAGFAAPLLAMQVVWASAPDTLEGIASVRHINGLMLIVVRVLGKRTVGNFSAFDLIVALMLGAPGEEGSSEPQAADPMIELIGMLLDSTTSAWMAVAWAMSSTPWCWAQA